MKKHEWSRKVPHKRTSCGCRLTVKTYPGTDTVLGMYQPKHDHPIGDLLVTKMRVLSVSQTQHVLRLSAFFALVLNPRLWSAFSILSISYQLIDATSSSPRSEAKVHITRLTWTTFTLYIVSKRLSKKKPSNWLLKR